MNRIKNDFLLIVITAWMLVLTGCGGKIDTSLVIDTDNSGSRVMIYKADLKENRNNYKGSVSDIANAVSANCPKELDFTDLSTKETAVFRFELTFSSLDEYEKKINALRTAGGLEELRPPFRLSAPESVFADGVGYSEDFDSSDLLVWFQNLLSDGGYVDPGNKSRIFDEGQNGRYTVYGSGAEGTRPKIDTVKYLPINGIDLHTKINNDNTYDRTIEVKIPQISMDAKGEKIKAYLKDVTAAEAAGEWTRDGDVHTYTIRLKSADAETLNSVMGTFYSKKSGSYFEGWNAGESLLVDEYLSGEEAGTGTYGNGSVEEILKKDGGSENPDPNAWKEAPVNKDTFTDSRRIVENLKLDNYVTGSNNALNLRYFVYNRGEYRGTGKAKDGNERTLSAGADDAKEELVLFSSNDDAEISLDYVYTYKYTLTSAAITLKPKGDGTVIRDVTLDFNDKLTDEQLERLRSGITDRLDKVHLYYKEHGIPAEIILKNLARTDDGFTASIASKADPGTESELWEKGFGGNNRIRVTTNSKAFLPLIKTTNVEDDFDLSMFADGKINEVEYTIKGIGNTGAYDAGSEYRKGTDYVRTYTNRPAYCSLNHSVTGSRIHFFAPVLFLLAAGAFITTGIFSAPLIKRKIRGRKTDDPVPAKKTAIPAETEGMDPESKDEVRIKE